eukprot:TRINITY_DN68009_c0_g1_i1.p1 TRINITY_DN68009_c0_g1~~TRINITY_DN68009_c0_g1_i1.p1  ORF type:complete len:641 (+),score=77.47 TRINITY_DN68009_c0_g1_i1:57-1979(+)
MHRWNAIVVVSTVLFARYIILADGISRVPIAAPTGVATIVRIAITTTAASWARTEAADSVDVSLPRNDKGMESKDVETESTGDDCEGDSCGDLWNIDLIVGIFLLGSVTFVMQMFSLAHHPDPDMRFYTWKVINNTITIFISVLCFSGFNDVLHKSIFPNTSAAAIDLVQMLIYYILLQIVPAFNAGIMQENALDGFSFEEQRDDKQRSVSCSTSLLSHIAAFASISFGGDMQHSDYVLASSKSAFFIPLLMFCFHGIIAAVSARCRVKVANLFHREASDTAALDINIRSNRRQILVCIYENYVSEAMNDTCAVAVSFLTVQAIRYKISGVMPDTLGSEEHSWIHDKSCSVILSAVTVFFLVFAIFLRFLNASFTATPGSGSFRQNLESLFELIHLFSKMSLSWCLVNLLRWEVGRARIPHGNPNEVVPRMVMATAVSFAAFGAVYYLDRIADADFTGASTDKAIFDVIVSISIMVGFMWEQAFDGGIEVISSHLFAPSWGKLAMVSFVARIVITPWNRHIISKLIQLEAAREEKIPADDSPEVNEIETQREYAADTVSPYQAEGRTITPRAPSHSHVVSNGSGWDVVPLRLAAVPKGIVSSLTGRVSSTFCCSPPSRWLPPSHTYTQMPVASSVEPPIE